MRTLQGAFTTIFLRWGVAISTEQNKKVGKSLLFVLVEMAGVEPASENSFLKLSTSVVTHLHSLIALSCHRPCNLVALLFMMYYKAFIHSHLLLNDIPFRAAVLSGECSLQLRQQEVVFYYCRLFS